MTCPLTGSILMTHTFVSNLGSLVNLINITNIVEPFGHLIAAENMIPCCMIKESYLQIHVISNNHSFVKNTHKLLKIKVNNEILQLENIRQKINLRR